MGDLFKLDAEMVVSVGLVIALVAAEFFGMETLSTNIAAGLVGWMGRSKLTNSEGKL